jgi:hypothetical protein
MGRSACCVAHFFRVSPSGHYHLKLRHAYQTATPVPTVPNAFLFGVSSVRTASIRPAVSFHRVKEPAAPKLRSSTLRLLSIFVPSVNCQNPLIYWRPLADSNCRPQD